MSAVNAQFPINVVQVNFDSAFAQAKLMSDGLIGKAGTSQLCYLLLADREPGKTLNDALAIFVTCHWIKCAGSITETIRVSANVVWLPRRGIANP
jgi:hypothetical protein